MTIHAKRGPVWGVRWFAMCAIGQRMSKRAAIICLVLLPFVSFGGLYPDFVEFVDNPTNILYMRVYTYTSAGTVVYNDVNGTRYTLPSYVMSYVKIGAQLNTFSDKIVHPLGDNEVYQTTPSVDYPLSRYYDRSRYYCLDYLPDFSEALNICCNLIVQGYRSPVVEIMKEAPNNIYCNFRVGDVFRDVLTGTNTAFRSMLLSQLSNVNGSLQSLALSLGTVSADYKTVNSLYLDPSKQNLLDSAATPSSLNANSSIASNLDRLFGSSYAGREAEISKALSDLARSQLQAAWLSTLDPDSPFYMQNLDNIISDPDKFQQAALQGGGGGGSALANIMRDVKKLSTNDWVSGVTNQLANNRASITNQLAHMFDDDSNPVTSHLNNIDNSTGSIDERLARGITVAVVNSGANSVLVSLDGPINIDQTQFNSLSVPLGSLQSTISDWYSDWYTFFNYSDPSYRWSNFFNMFSSFKDQNHSDLSSLLSLSNSLSGIDSLLRDYLPQITNSFSSDFSALLLDDYDDYISNAHYSSFLSDLQNNYPDVYSDLVSLGLSSQSGSGNWWTLAVSSLGYLSAQVHSNVVMFSSVFGDIQRVKQFAADNGNFDGDFYSAASDVISSIPSKTQVANYIEQCTNAANSVSALELVSFYSTASNEVNKVFRLFNRGSNLPSEVVIMHHGLNGEHTFSIPVGDQPRLWLLIRLGIMFVTCAVNLILLPKFILKIFILFMTMFKKSIPYLNSDYN